MKPCSVDKTAKENFRGDTVTFLLRMVEKLQEKSPLKYQIVPCLNCFVSEAMIEKKECVFKFDKIVESMHEKGHLSAKGSGNTKHQFNDFIDNIAQKNFNLFSGFDLTGERIVLTIFMVNG